MTKPSLREVLQQRVIVADGAMGTYLYQQGISSGISYEEMNVTQPDRIAAVHLEYIQAGAKLIETNTFSASREKLAKYGLEHQWEAINRAGVRLAKDAVPSDIYIAGAVGSLRAGRRTGMNTPVKLEKSFSEQIAVLLEEGVDGILLETFTDLSELRVAVEVVRRLDASIPLIAQFAVEMDGCTQDGVKLNDAFGQIRSLGADIVGLNCRSGPMPLLRLLQQVAGEGPYSVFPNAGLADYVDGKIKYSAEPSYFAHVVPELVANGVRLIGGCCGTTPEHIRAISEAVKVIESLGTNVEVVQAPSVETVKIAPIEPLPEARKADEQDVERVLGRIRAFRSPEQPSIVEQVKKRHTVIVELDPPRDLDIDKFIRGCMALKAVNCDAVTLADNSLAVTRMSNLALGQWMRSEVGVRPLLHIACRDRNLIGTQSHMMGMSALGIDHVLCVTGDPARFGDLPGSSSVYDMTSFDMIRMVKQLNQGVAFSGKALKQNANFVVGAAFNPNVKYLDKAIQRLEKKVEAGADYIMTQPVYDPKIIIELAEKTKHIQVPIFIGIMPLANGRNAEYLHNEVPGIQLSDDVRRRMAGLEGEEGRQVGVQIARELLDVAMDHFNGIYLITPFFWYEMTASLTEYVWARTGAKTRDSAKQAE